MLPRSSFSCTRLCFLALAIILLALPARSRVPRPPQNITLWVWERAEDVRFVPAETSLAVLVRSIELRGHDVVVYPRQQPLRSAPHAPITAVIRLDARAAALDASQRIATAAAIARAATLPRLTAVQIDFDATASQRAFYRDLLFDLRHRLPAGMPLSITALASWCLHDDWIAGLPVNDAVPMLFRMGRDRDAVVSWLNSGRDFREPLCRNSIGIATDEPPPPLPAGRRVYIFAPVAWTPQLWQHAEREVQP